MFVLGGRLLHISMAILNCNSIIKLQIVASSNDSSSSSPSLSQQPQLKPSKQPGKQSNRKLKKPQQKQQQQQQQQPTVFEIERAIGAGVFRDRDPNSEAEDKPTGLFDNILRNTVGKNEGDVEKKLRETGEWLLSRTENTSRSAGKQILEVMFLLVIPLWMTAFLVASGILHLPFNSPFLDSFLNS